MYCTDHADGLQQQERGDEVEMLQAVPGLLTRAAGVKVILPTSTKQTQSCSSTGGAGPVFC